RGGGHGPSMFFGGSEHACEASTFCVDLRATSPANCEQRPARDNHRMSHRRSVHDLKSLVLSYHSLIVIETVEEERVQALLHEVAMDLRLSSYEWSLTSGFARA